MTSRIERICVEHGLKMTGQRRVIARVLSDAEDHPDVEELYRRASALDGRISIATVYRTVRLLEERGILERRDFGGGRARYEPTEHGRHYHLIDIDTGRVIEFEGGEHERLMEQIAARLGFELVSTRLEIYGRRAEGAQAGLTEGAQAGLTEGAQAGLTEGAQAGLTEGAQAGLAEGGHAEVADGPHAGFAESAHARGAQAAIAGGGLAPVAGAGSAHVIEDVGGALLGDKSQGTHTIASEASPAGDASGGRVAVRPNGAAR